MARNGLLHFWCVVVLLQLLIGSVHAQFDTVINLPDDLEIIRGSVGNRSGATRPTTQVNVDDGGRVDEGFGAFAASEINIRGGTVDPVFHANFRSVVNISGGSIGGFFDANSGSSVNISGGSLGDRFEAFAGSDVNIRGGNVGHIFHAKSGSNVELIGGEFVLNGNPLTGSVLTLTADDLLTGTLADGSTFIFSDSASDVLQRVRLTAAPLPAVQTAPRFVSTDVSWDPSGLRAGERLTLQSGGELGNNFAVVDAVLNIEDGMVGNSMEIAGGEVNMYGGYVAGGIDAYFGSVVNISGGNLGTVSEPFSRNVLDAYPGSVVNIDGGRLGRGVNAHPGSVVNLSGGRLDGSFSANGKLRVSGGRLGFNFVAGSQGEVNFVGSEFFLNGAPLDRLQLFAPFEITDRGGALLTGTLADGSAFNISLNDRSTVGAFFHPGATVTVTRIPEPTSVMLLLASCVGLLLCRRAIARS